MGFFSKGSRIAVFAASSPVDRAALDASLALVRGWGLVPVLGPERSRRDYLAGTDDERLAELEWALSAPDCAGAWAARGGYGLTRILPRLDTIRLDPRPVIGFSDVTALLCALEKRGWRQLVHGPNLHGLATHSDRVSANALKRLLISGQIPTLRARSRGLWETSVRGRLLGGNLAVLASMAGSRDQLCCKDALLLLEDVNEPSYRLDRYLTQLHAAGCLDGVRGAILGEFEQGRQEARARAVLTELLEGWQIPVLQAVTVGHGKRNLPFVVGSNYEMGPTALRHLDDVDDLA